MGYTIDELRIISRHLDGVESVLDFGSQIDYTGTSQQPRFADKWYQEHGVTDYTCIDLAGDNNAIQINWSYPIEVHRQFDLVVDSGSSEHSAQALEYTNVGFAEGRINSIYPKGDMDIEAGYYHCWMNKHNFLKVGGVMANFNPLTLSWPGHCYTWLTEDFYLNFVKLAGYEILEHGKYAACGNITDGWNCYGVIRKTSNKFPTLEEFRTLDLRQK